MKPHKPIASLLLATLLSQQASAEWAVNKDKGLMGISTTTNDAALIYGCNGAVDILRRGSPAPLIAMAVDAQSMYLARGEPHVVKVDGESIMQVSMQPPLELLVDMLSGGTLRVTWDAETILEFDITGFWSSLITLNCAGNPEQKV